MSKDWRVKGKKLTQGKWIRFDESTPKWILTFVGEPTVVEKTTQTGPNKGEKYEVMSFPVEVDGEDKILEPNRSLLLVLMDEDEDEDIIGRTFMIKCLDLKSKRSWKMIEQESPLVASKKNKEEEEEEEEKETEEEEEDNEEEEEKAKEKFKKEVEKRTAKRKKKEKKPEKDVENVEPHPPARTQRARKNKEEDIENDSKDDETSGESGEEETTVE